MGLQAADIGDLVSSTLRDLGRGKWTDLTSDIQQHHAMKRLMSKRRMKVYDSGYEFQFNVMTGHNNSARFVPLDYTAQVNITDNLIQGSHPFRHVTHNWGINRTEIAMNRAGPNRILELIKVRRKAAMIALVEKMEKAFWQCPAAADEESPHGVAYWIVKSSTAYTTNDGFNGGAPSGYTTVGGINPTTYSRWKNWAAPYTDVSKADLITKLDAAMDLTEFTPPVDMPTYNEGDSYELLTTRSVRKSLKDIAESQNDNLGFDLDPAQGKVRYRRTPVTWVKVLDSDTDAPLYGINWGEFFVATLRGEWMVDTSFDKLPNQPKMSVVHTDSTFNYATFNRRRHFVLSTGTSGSVS
jgi:hypothetical protein